jgi:hypothetical protein
MWVFLGESQRRSHLCLRMQRVNDPSSQTQTVLSHERWSFVTNNLQSRCYSEATEYATPMRHILRALLGWHLGQ